MYCYLNYICKETIIWRRRFGIAGVGARPQFPERACRRSQNRHTDAPDGHNFGTPVEILLDVVTTDKHRGWGFLIRVAQGAAAC
jgi:hypothetical protein